MWQIVFRILLSEVQDLIATSHSWGHAAPSGDSGARTLQAASQHLPRPSRGPRQKALSSSCSQPALDLDAPQTNVFSDSPQGAAGAPARAAPHRPLIPHNCPTQPAICYESPLRCACAPRAPVASSPRTCCVSRRSLRTRTRLELALRGTAPMLRLTDAGTCCGAGATSGGMRSPRRWTRRARRHAPRRRCAPSTGSTRDSGATAGKCARQTCVPLPCSVAQSGHRRISHSHLACCPSFAAR